MQGLAARLEWIGFPVIVKPIGEVHRYIGFMPVSSPAGFEPVPDRLGFLDAVLENWTSSSPVFRVRLSDAQAVVAHCVHWGVARVDGFIVSPLQRFQVYATAIPQLYLVAIC